MLHDEADEALMLRYQQGEVRAFEVLLNRHRKPVFNFIFRFVQNRDLAEDLLQESFLRVIKSAAKYKRQAKFTTWLYTIARNLCVDQSRRAKHRRAQSLDAPMSTSEGSSSLMDVTEGDALPADRAVVSQRIQQKLQGALGTLSEEQREVFLMREFLDMPFKEIAQVVDTSENTVKSRMRYALQKLQMELEEFSELAKVIG